MIVFGFGKRTGKDVGPSVAYTCPRCSNNVRFRLVDQRNWFTLFFIPVIPYSHHYLEMCPICSFARELSKLEFEQAVAAGLADQTYLNS